MSVEVVVVDTQPAVSRDREKKNQSSSHVSSPLLYNKALALAISHSSAW